ncbi:MarR family winged helix-turn-helix transcriptional regulator [Flaviaesturariibacter amylovorans]|uniref:MarR family transcriptional regulator n=1 Tax=Flaviaesturariibacter amylovorans TaxID=1084520 RepID=A0ABP8HRP3_9BACT
MGIEQDIHQKKFVSAKQKAMINLLYTYGWIMERVKHFLASEDITHQQFNILRILRGAAPEPLSTLQIRERMLDKMSDTSRIVDRLVAKELVQKCTCPKDKRLVDVTISPKGLALLEKIDKEGDHIEEIMGRLSEAEATQLSNMLDQLRG